MKLQRWDYFTIIVSAFNAIKVSVVSSSNALIIGVITSSLVVVLLALFFSQQVKVERWISQISSILMRMYLKIHMHSQDYMDNAYGLLGVDSMNYIGILLNLPVMDGIVLNS